MKRFAGIFVAMPAALLLGGASKMDAVPQETAVRWRTDWEAARAEARQAGKPLFVVFR